MKRSSHSPERVPFLALRHRHDANVWNLHTALRAHTLVPHSTSLRWRSFITHHSSCTSNAATSPYPCIRAIHRLCADSVVRQYCQNNRTRSVLQVPELYPLDPQTPAVRYTQQRIAFVASASRVQCKASSAVPPTPSRPTHPLQPLHLAVNAPGSPRLTPLAPSANFRLHHTAPHA